MSRIITGLSGEIKAGKGMIEQWLKRRYDCDYTRFSVPLAKGLDTLGLPHTRENLQDISTLLRRGRREVPADGAFEKCLWEGLVSKTPYETFSERMRAMFAVFHHPTSWSNLMDIDGELERGCGEDILAKAIAKDCEKATKDCMIVDGVRRMADIVMLTKLPNFHLVYITAPLDMRLAWAIAAAEKVGDASLTDGKFRIQNDAESEREIPIVGANAHLRIDNTGTKEEVYAALAAYFDRVDALQ